MSSGPELQSGSLLDQLDQHEPQLDSKVIRLMITMDTPYRGEVPHQSRFIECMDYSISSFDLDPRVQEASNRLTAQLGAPPSPTKPVSTTPRPIARGFGGFVRKLSLRAPPKRDLLSSLPSGLLQLQPVLHNSGCHNPVNLCRKKSDKGSRLISPLVIEPAKNEPWRVGFGKKSFTPSCSLNSAVSPISSLCSSTSGSSTQSGPIETLRGKQHGSADVGLGRTIQRSNSTTQICIPPSISLRSFRTSSTNASGRTFEVLSRASSSRRKSRSLEGKHLIPTSFSMLPTSPSLSTNATNQATQI